MIMILEFWSNLSVQIKGKTGLPSLPDLGDFHSAVSPPCRWCWQTGRARRSSMPSKSWKRTWWSRMMMWSAPWWRNECWHCKTSPPSWHSCTLVSRQLYVSSFFLSCHPNVSQAVCSWILSHLLSSNSCMVASACVKWWKIPHIIAACILNIKNNCKDFPSCSYLSRPAWQFLNVIICALQSQSLKPRFPKVPKYF